ncbi:MAG: hypothetical protein AAGA12_03295 [Pseudomonadota bacterium]
MIRGLPLLAVLTACAPVPMTPERAEALCRDEAGLADGVQGRVSVGIGTGGTRARTGVVFTDRVFDPKGEDEFLEDCIARRMAGKPAPTRVGISIGARL